MSQLVISHQTVLDSDLPPYSIIKGSSTLIAGTPKPSVIQGEHFYRLGADITFRNLAGTYDLFNHAMMLNENTIYFLAMEVVFSRPSGTTSHTLRFRYEHAGVPLNVADVNALSRLVHGAGTITRINALSTNQSFGHYGDIDGHLSTALNVAGNTYFNTSGVFITGNRGLFVPRATFSAAPGGVTTVKTGSFIRLIPIASADKPQIGRMV